MRQANELGINKTSEWSMGSLHPAMRYNIDRDYGALGHSRRADIVIWMIISEVQQYLVRR